jgi:hypothetical protein
MEGGKIIMGFKTVISQQTFGYGIRRNSSLRPFLLMLSYMVVNFRAIMSLDNRGERWSKSKSIL